MVWEKGQKTKSSHLWLTDEDVRSFSDALYASMPEIVWNCSHVGNDRKQIHFYSSIHDALKCNKGENHAFVLQASTQLPVGQTKTLGLLLLNYSLQNPRIVIPARDFGSHTDIFIYPERIICVEDSSLAIRWNTTDCSDELCAAMNEQVKKVWKALNQVTKPFKCHYLIDRSVDASTPRYRMGKHMYELVKREDWCIQQGQFFVVE